MNSMMQRQRGFGLIELMVAMVIGLISTLAIFQTFAASFSNSCQIPGDAYRPPRCASDNACDPYWVR